MRRCPLLEVRRDAVEENTGEKFSFRESLPANADFVPDLQPAEGRLRHVRALADVCLVLMNTNEFAYVCTERRAGRQPPDGPHLLKTDRNSNGVARGGTRSLDAPGRLGAVDQVANAPRSPVAELSAEL